MYYILDNFVSLNLRMYIIQIHVLSLIISIYTYIYVYIDMKACVHVCARGCVCLCAWDHVKKNHQQHWQWQFKSVV